MVELAPRVAPTLEISPIRTAVERIAAFTHAARPEDLTPGIRRLYKRNILDSLGCAIAALPAAPFSALRDQVAEYRAPGNCTLIAGGKTAPDQTEIALACGFADQSHLNRSFRRVVGTSPGHWRRISQYIAY